MKLYDVEITWADGFVFVEVDVKASNAATAERKALKDMIGDIVSVNVMEVQ